MIQVTNVAAVRPRALAEAHGSGLPSPVRAALLDLDGTVADTHSLIVRCYDHAIRTHLGRDGVYDIWQDRIGLPLDDILIATLDHFGETYDAERIELLKQAYRAHQREQLHTISAFEGIGESLAALKARGIKLSIVTTKHRIMAMAHLEKLDLLSLFDAVVAGDDCDHCKPHPEPFLRALALLNVSACEAVAIGDSRQDILGARAAGVFAIGALWGADNLSALFEALPDCVADIPAELAKLIDVST